MKILNLHIIFLFTFNFCIFAQTESSIQEKYITKTINVESGLPQNTVNSIVQSKQGYLWIGTNAGLVRYDGLNIVTFTKINCDSISNDQILSLHIDSKDVLWIGTDGGGLLSYSKGIWKKFTMGNGLSNNHIRTITSDWHGNVWIGTEYGLNCLSNGQFEKFTIMEGLPDNIITTLDYDIWGNLWIGTLCGGIAKLQHGIIQNYNIDVRLNNSMINALYTDEIGNLFIGTLKGLFYHKYGKLFITKIPDTRYLPITSIEKTEADGYWLGTVNNGLAFFKNNQIQRNYLDFPKQNIKCIFKDKEKNIWIGTETNGVILLKKSIITNYNKQTELPGNLITSIIQDDDDNFWLAIKNIGLCQYRNNKIIKIWGENTKLAGKKITALFFDSNRVLWIGTEASGIFKLQKGKLTTLSINDGLTSNNITSIIQTTNKEFLIGTEKGLNIYNGIFQKISDKFNLQNKWINVLIKNPDNEIFIGTKSTIYKKSGNTYQELFPNMPNLDVISLYEDKMGVLWIGTKGNGLRILKDNKLSLCTTENGLHDNYIYSITEDRYNNIWMSSNTGVFKVERDNFTRFLKNNKTQIFSSFFNESDGMTSSQCIGNIQPAVWKNRLGLLYYPTAQGISCFNPDLFYKTLPPNIIIEKFLVDDNSINYINEIKFDHKINKARIEFTSFNSSAPEKMWFRYKLDGFNEKYTYVKPGEARIAEYDNLKAGNYSFLIQAKNNNSEWSGINNSIKFNIDYPFFKKPVAIFSLLSVLVSVGIFLSIIKKNQVDKSKPEKYKTSSLDKDIADGVIAKLTRFMDEEKIYLNPDLTLKILAKKLNIHINYLSRIINEHFHQNYNDFINKYRIEEAKKLLSSTKEKNKTVSEIMYACGFYSKSTFNSAFRKFTDLTPSQYRKKLL